MDTGQICLNGRQSHNISLTVSFIVEKYIILLSSIVQIKSMHVSDRLLFVGASYSQAIVVIT